MHLSYLYYRIDLAIHLMLCFLCELTLSVRVDDLTVDFVPRKTTQI